MFMCKVPTHIHVLPYLIQLISPLLLSPRNHRTFSRGELGRYPKKDVATYWQCEDYPKAWGHGQSLGTTVSLWAWYYDQSLGLGPRSVSWYHGQSLGLVLRSVSGFGATVSLWAWGHGQSLGLVPRSVSGFGATVSLWAWGHGQSLGLVPRSVSGLGATVSLWATEISLYNIQPNTTHILQLTPRAD